MFIGHYGVSLDRKAYVRSIPLRILFLAVQLVDVLWAFLAPLNIEKVRIGPASSRSSQR